MEGMEPQNAGEQGAHSISIGNLEAELHDAYARSLTPEGDLAYQPDQEAHSRLDEYCNPHKMDRVAAPLVVVGPTGCGKSALLANWRKEYMRRYASTRKREAGCLVFYHAAGCTRHSSYVEQLLWRLLNYLKSNLDLGRDVPEEAGRLPWDFLRFLQLAGSKSRVVLIIDGLHRLQNEAGEHGLQWLPLQLPANVRLIVSATTAGYAQLAESENLALSGVESSMIRRKKTILELERRGWPFLSLGPLTAERKEAIIARFLGSPDAATRRPHALSTFITGVDEHEGKENPGKLHLFPSMVEQMVHAAGTECALFLAIVLKSLSLANERGYDLRSLLRKLLACKGVQDLCHCVLQIWESGHTPNAVDIEAARESCRREGGYSALMEYDHELCGRIGSGSSIGVSQIAHVQEEARLIFQSELSTKCDSESGHDDEGLQDEGEVEPDDYEEEFEADSEQEQEACDEEDVTNLVERQESRDEEHGSDSGQKDPVLDLECIPVGLRGGKLVDASLQKVLGQALALLYIVRHGLREKELWHQLATFAAKDAEAALKGNEDRVVDRMASKIIQNRGRLIDHIRNMDTNRDGVVDMDEFRASLKALDLGLTPEQEELLIASIDLDGDGILEYEELHSRLDLVVRAKARGSRMSLQPLPVAQALEHKESNTGLDTAAGYVMDEIDKEYNPTDYFSLLADTKALLQRALVSLGICRYSMHDILIMGLDVEDLRSVVFSRYVCSEGLWHQRLVTYFSLQPASLRRCEELPWHLRHCYQWNALKRTCSDLKTFEIMWNSVQLRRELTEYWRLLTQGPLYLSAEAEAVDAEDDSSRLLGLMTLKSSANGSAAPSAADVIAAGRKLASNGKLGTFDLVFEYNGAVQSWQTQTRPSVRRLGQMIDMIGEFLRLMSVMQSGKHATSSPPFLHYPLRFRVLEGLGIDAELIGYTGENNDREQEVPPGSDGKLIALSEPKPIAAACAREGFKPVPFYYFQRWLWIQFPWMALSQAGVIVGSKLDSLPPAAGLTSTSHFTRMWEARRIDTTPDMSSLRETPGLQMMAHLKTKPGTWISGRLGHSSSYDSLMNSIADGSLTKSASANTPLDAAGSAGSTTTTQVSVGSNGNTRPGRLTEDDNAPEGEEVQFLAGIARPHAHDILPDSEISGLMTRTVTYDDEGKEVRLPPGPLWGGEEQLRSILPNVRIMSSTSGGPLIPLGKTMFARSFDEERVDEVKSVVAQLRKLMDQILEEKRCKKLQLNELRLTAAVRDEQDEYTAATTIAGEQMMDALHVRLKRVSSVNTQVNVLGTSYSKIIEVCTANPPKDDAHVTALEKQVALAGQQAQDLVSRMSSLIAHKNDIERYGIKRLRRHLERMTKVRNQVLQRTDSLRAAIKSGMQAELRGTHGGDISNPSGDMDGKSSHLFNSRGRMSSSVLLRSSSKRADIGSGEGARASQNGSSSNSGSPLRPARPSQERQLNKVEKEAKEKRQQQIYLVAEMDGLTRAMGGAAVPDTARIWQEVLDRKEELQKEAEVGTVRVERLRAELKRVNSELAELHATGNDIEPEPSECADAHSGGRFTEDEVLQGEIKLERSKRKLATTLSFVNEVMTSIEHIAKLMNSVHIPGIPSLVPPASPEDVNRCLRDSLEHITKIKSSMAGGLDLSAASEDMEMPNFWHSGCSPGRVGQDVPDPSSDLMGSLDYAWGIDASMPLDGQCTDDSDVRVISAKNRDLKFQRSMDHRTRKVDEVLAMQEAEVKNFDESLIQRGTASYFGKALKTGRSMAHLRHANMLMGGPQGQGAGFGLIMDSVFADRALTPVEGASGRATKSSARKKLLSTHAELAPPVLDRIRHKGLSDAMVARKKAEGKKIIARDPAEDMTSPPSFTSVA